MEIRNMVIEDYERVHNLWMSCKGMGLNDVDDSKQGIDAFLRRNPGTCFVAVEKVAVIGAIMAGHDGRRGYIYHTAVSPTDRNRGIGKTLVEHTLQALADQGITKAALVVFARNETGNAFWEKQGFTVREDLIYRNLALTELKRIDT